MNSKRQVQIAFFVLLFFIGSYANAAVKYGDAQIKKGKAVIVREGRLYRFSSNDNPVVVYENDVIRTMGKSSLTLNTPDKNRILLGSNAIIQVKKWRKKKSKGILRMLFGKFRARTAKFRKKRLLRLRTATATIGVKGSLGEGATDPDFTSVANLGGEMVLDGNDIPPGEISFTVDNIGFEISTFENLGFDPAVSEDEQEVLNPDKLETDDPKQVEPEPIVQQAIVDNVRNVLDNEGVSSDGTEPGGENPENSKYHIDSYINKIVQDVKDIHQKSEILIEVEP